MQIVNIETSVGIFSEPTLYKGLRLRWERGRATLLPSTSSDSETKVWKTPTNYVVPDTKKWEQQAAYYLDKHPMVDAFVKNAGLGFAIPYLYNGQPHDYMPDFIVRIKTEPPIQLILETKGYDPLAEVKAAAQRWVSAVNADGSYGRWAYAMVRQVSEVNEAVTRASGASLEKDNQTGIQEDT